MKYVIFASGGNDSVALVQFAAEAKLTDVTVAYSNTGWAATFWEPRMDAFEAWVRSKGFDFVTIQSEGMRALIKRKKAWPRGGGGKFQFCTAELKEKPALKWLDDNDPDKITTCMIGVRRCESANRATFPEWTDASERHGGRELWAPLVRHSDEDRNALLAKTPFKPLPHRSRECYPCVNANKKELKLLDENRIETIEILENEMGTNSKGNKRVMFSPKRENGAVGIRAVVNAANDGTGDMFGGCDGGCDGGWCGD